jgi:hypothetical protein
LDILHSRTVYNRSSQYKDRSSSLSCLSKRSSVRTPTVIRNHSREFWLLNTVSACSLVVPLIQSSDFSNIGHPNNVPSVQPTQSHTREETAAETAAPAVSWSAWILDRLFVCVLCCVEWRWRRLDHLRRRLHTLLSTFSSLHPY